MTLRPFLVPLALLLSTLAHAQIRPVASSLGLYVATSDRVYLAHVTHIGETTGTGKTSQTAVTLAVDQTLKGTAASSLSLDFSPNWYRWETHPRFIANTEKLTSSRHLLLCIRPISLGHAKVIVFDLDDPAIEEFSDSLAVLRTPESILKDAKAIALRYPLAIQNPKTVYVGPGNDALKGTEFYRFDNYVLAPDQPQTPPEGQSPDTGPHPVNMV